jgi:heme exporter protein D
MHWESLQAFIDMGGYAVYIWGSFGVTAAAMLVEVLLLRRRTAGLAQQQEEQA